jgi:HEAT repeat protein
MAVLFEALGAPTKAVQRGAAEALAALGRAGEAAVEQVLARALHDGDGRRRWGAAYAWSRLGCIPPACLPVLLDALGASDGDLRWASAAILRELGDGDEVVAALRGLLGSVNPLQRKMALYCLRDLAPRDAGLEAHLLGALDDVEPAVRLAAMAALAHLAIDRDGAGRALVARLDDADPGVRRAAAAALGRLGLATPAVTAALRRALGAGDAGLARAASRALAALDAAIDPEGD